jgi:dethiobiotin synthetase/malonyl-CoA O-methyltransferase
MHRYRGHAALKYWKPIQTGIEHDDDTAMVLKLGDCDESELHPFGIRLPRPVAPYLAAALGGVRITIADLLGHVGNESEDLRWIAEGAGGALVPINDSESMIDLITALGLPVLIAARSTLGTINHTLLTIETLRRRNLEVAGVVMIGNRNPANREAIEHYGAVSVIAEMPHFPALTTDCLGRWATSEFDTTGRLARYFK